MLQNLLGQAENSLSKLADKRTWTRRYDAINRFEAELFERFEPRLALTPPPVVPTISVDTPPEKPKRGWWRR